MQFMKPMKESQIIVKTYTLGSVRNLKMLFEFYSRLAMTWKFKCTFPLLRNLCEPKIL